MHSIHSITDIVAETSTYGHDATAKKDKTKKEETKTEAAKTTDTNKSDSSLPLIISIAAALPTLIALVLH